MRIFLAALAAGFFYSQAAFAQTPPPAYLTLSSSPHDFELFANGGWDGNWYVGYNSMWVAEISSAPEGDWGRAFIGAKLGRMKTKPVPGQPPWIQAPVPCEIYMGISSTSAWTASDNYFLTPCEDIPLEGSPEDALRGVGESVWFWKEVPVRALNFGGKNYLAIWSPTPELSSSQSAPVIAAAASKNAVPAWLNRTIQGAAPSRPDEVLETRLNAFAPSLAIKLIPRASTGSVEVELVGFYDSSEAFRWEVQVTAKNLARVQPQVSIDGVNWISFGRPLIHPPFVITLPRERIRQEISRSLPTKRKLDQAYIRMRAWDEWENQGHSASFVVYSK